VWKEQPEKIEEQEGVGEKVKKRVGNLFRACSKASDQRKIGLAGISRSVGE
jgi:hypothetical protein